MAEEKKITTAQRMMNFAALTRQHMHMLPAQTATSELETLQFTLPKTRLLAQIFLKVDVTCTGVTEKSPVPAYNPYRILRNISLDLNNGFRPFVMSGEEAAIYNTVATHSDKITGANGMYKESGTKGKYSFVLELKNTLNDSMLQGLILLQNNATMVTLNVDIGKVSDVFIAGTFGNVKVTPMIVTYSVPAIQEAFPDISVLKLMQSKTVSFNAAGDNTIYLDTGTIYRKLIVYMQDGSGAALDISKVTGNLELAFNGADIPYSIDPEMLMYLNADQFGRRLPTGVYVFDFSSQSPLIGYGGSRDYIDTEKLTQFTLKAPTSVACKITTITEQLSRLA